MRKRLISVVLTSAATVATFLVVTTQPAAAAIVTSFSQCENGTGTALNCPGGWTNGALQSSNSHYTEDTVVPQRAVLAPGDTANHTFSFEYMARKGSIHAYDSLATWNITQATADPCQGIAASLCSTPPTTFPMASDSTLVPPADIGISINTSTHELPATSRRWTIYNGVITATSAITHDSPLSGDDDATAGFTFHAISASTPVVILFGGHLAVSSTVVTPRAWGVVSGASHVSGGPYHIRVGDYDGGSAGSTSNSIQAGALNPGFPSFTISKSALPFVVAANGTVNYAITVTNTGTAAGSASFIDNFDDRLTPTTPTSTPGGGTCTREPSGTDLYFDCNTSFIPPLGGTQVFAYSAVMPDSFDSSDPGAGATPCVANQYLVKNTATLDTGGDATGNVCVSATPSFTISKSADPMIANPGDPVEYTVTVHNTGTAPGSTSFTDDYDERLTPTGFNEDDCDLLSVLGNAVLHCTTPTIPAGDQLEYTYTADMPESFTSPPAAGCTGGRFPVHNDATLLNSNTPASVTVCVNATPSFTISKQADVTTAGPGDTVTYTITITNGGAASGSTTWTDDYDDRLTPDPVITLPIDPCGFVAPGGNKKLSCTTPVIAPNGGQFIYQYTVELPSSFDESPGGPNGCTASDPEQYEIDNTATLANGSSDDETVCVNAAPDFDVTKGVLPAVTTPGQTVTYTVTVTNNGDASGSIGFTDNYADGLTSITTPAGCSIVTPGGDAQFSCTTGKILAGGHQTFTYTAKVPATFTGSSGAGDCDPGQYPVDNTVVLENGADADSEVCVNASPTLGIAKDASPMGAGPGDLVTYTITVKNTGSAPGSMSFHDDFNDRLSPSTPTTVPAGGTCDREPSGTDLYFNCSTGTIEAKSQIVFTYTASMPETFGTPPTGSTGCPPGQFPINNTITHDDVQGPSARVCVDAAPEFSITKTSDLSVANPGDPVTYTITVFNNGSAAGSTTFRDDFDNRLVVDDTAIDISGSGGSCDEHVVSLTNHVLDCTTGTIAAGDHQTFQYTASMPKRFTIGLGTLGCTGRFPVKNTATLAGNAGNDSVTVCVNASPTFTVEKTANTFFANAGDPVTYTITVHNGGSAPGSTTFDDNYDDRVTPGAVTSDPDGGTCAPTVLPSTTDEILHCTTSSIEAGDDQTFEYTITTPTDFTGSPDEELCGGLAYSIINTVTLANNATDTFNICVFAEPVFTLTKTPVFTEANPNDPITYNITVENHGTAAGSTSVIDAYDARLSFTLPEGCAPLSSGPLVNLIKCDTGIIPVETQRTFTYTANMPPTYTGDPGGFDCTEQQYPIFNTAQLTPDFGFAMSVVCVNAAPNFRITKLADQTLVAAGDLVTYTVTVYNDGAASGSTSFIDDYATGLDPSDPTIDPAGGQCSDDGDVISCDTGVILAGQHQTFTYTATMPETFSGRPDPGCTNGRYPVINAAFLPGAESGPAVTVCVSTAPRFKIRKSASPEDALPGQTVTYTVTVTNGGSGPGTTTFTDDYDERVTLNDDLETVPLGGTCGTGMIGANHVLNCTTSSIDPGDSQVFTYSVTLPESFEGTPGGGEDCDSDQYPIQNAVNLPDGPQIGAEVCVTAAPAFTITKSADPTTVDAGEPVTYTVTVHNGGTAEGATSFIDDYDDRITVDTPDNCTKITVVNNKVFSCTTPSILADHDFITTYTATMPASFSDAPAGSPCTRSNPEQHAIINYAVLANGGAADPVTVCVNAAPDFSVSKSGAPNPAQPGGLVTYTVTVHNGGTASGATSFNDNFDDRLNVVADGVVISPVGGSCSIQTIDDDRVLHCTTSTINAGDDQTFSYSARVPTSFSGNPGGDGCSADDPQQYPITNTVLEANGAPADRTICVNAAPIARIVKSVTSSNDTQGNQYLTYTLSYTNTGAATADTTQITDDVPLGTSFVSCGGGCIEPSSDESTVTWNLGPTPALTGGGVVSFVVLVTATTFCNVTNTAYLAYDDNDAVASNTVTTVIQPPDNPGGANASGNAVVARVTAAGLLDIDTQPLIPVSSTQHGIGTDFHTNGVLALNIPSASGRFLKLAALYDTSTSVVTAHPAIAFQNTATEIAKVCLVPVAGVCAVEANTLRSVAGAMATGGWASYSSAGSTIQGLKVAGVLQPPVNLNVTTKIPLNPGIFGSNSYVAINERTGVAGRLGGVYRADLTVTMIHVKITSLLGLQGVEIIVGKAVAHVDFPVTLVCGPSVNRSVSGFADVARLTVGPGTYPEYITEGYVELPPTGGTETQQLAKLNVGGFGGTILGATTADTITTGTITNTQVYSMSRAQIAGNGTFPICVIRVGTRCIVTAQVIRTQVQSRLSATSGISNDASTQLVGVSVLGIPIPVRVAPNTVIGIPGIGGLILNEQFCDNGGFTYTHSCPRINGHTGMTVRALHLIAVVPGFAGAELIVAEAHSDATFHVQSD